MVVTVKSLAWKHCSEFNPQSDLNWIGTTFLRGYCKTQIHRTIMQQRTIGDEWNHVMRAMSLVPCRTRRTKSPPRSSLNADLNSSLVKCVADAVCHLARTIFSPRHHACTSSSVDSISARQQAGVAATSDTACSAPLSSTILKDSDWHCHMFDNHDWRARVAIIFHSLL